MAWVYISSVCCFMFHSFNLAGLTGCGWDVLVFCLLPVWLAGCMAGWFTAWMACVRNVFFYLVSSLFFILFFFFCFVLLLYFWGDSGLVTTGAKSLFFFCFGFGFLFCSLLTVQPVPTTLYNTIKKTKKKK